MPNSRLFVGKLPADTQPEELGQYFAQFGTVTDVFLPTSNKSSKIAFITFEREKDTFFTLSKTHVFRGYEINVVQAKPKGEREVKERPSNGSLRVFIGGLPLNISKEELEAHFSRFGNVLDTNKPESRDGGGYEKGAFCFITYSTQAEVSACLAANPHNFKGKECRVVEARPSPGDSPKDQSDFGKRLFVGRLPTDTTAEELKEYFTSFGEVQDVFVPNSTRASSLGAYAFVTFKKLCDMYKALSVKDHQFKDASIQLTEAKPKPGRRGVVEEVSMNEPRLFIGKIPQSITDDEISEYFAQFGTVKDCYRPKGQDKDGKQFCFVVYNNTASVSAALSQETHIIRDARLNVKRAVDRGSKGRDSQGGVGHPSMAPQFRVPYQDSRGMYTQGRERQVSPYDRPSYDPYPRHQQQQQQQSYGPNNPGYSQTPSPSGYATQYDHNPKYGSHRFKPY